MSLRFGSFGSFAHQKCPRMSQAFCATVAGPGSDEVGRFAAHPALVSRCGVEMRRDMIAIETVSIDMRSVILASPVVLPAAVGVFVVALLSLRRGRQPWLEAGL